MASENQQTVYQWMNETFPGMDRESPRKALRALEEMVELCIASGASPNEVIESAFGAVQKSANDRMNANTGIQRPDQIPAEAADVLIVLFGVAGMRDFDLMAEVDKKMAINRAREWKANGDGTGYHVKKAVTS